ncbi:MAG: hypothetical protein ACREJQ_02280 [bacterium]
MKSLKDLSPSQRLLAIAFDISALLGYGFSLTYAHLRTGLKPAGIVEHFKGNDQAFAMDASVMYSLTHTHTLSIGLLLFAVGALFSLSSLHEKTKAWIIGLAFLSYLLEFPLYWLVRYSSPGFVYALYLVGAVSALTFVAMVYFTLKELLMPA